MTIEIPLLGADQVALVSDEDAWALRFSWRLSSQGYVQRTARLHRDITLADQHPDRQVDHINRVKHDNRRENLRLVTPQENCQNRDMRSDNESGYVGVHFRKGLGKWIARTMIDGRRVHLGAYDTALEAAEAVQRAKREDMERGGIAL